MTEISVIRTIDIPEKRYLPGKINLLYLLALFVDLFTPILIWKGMLPASVRWISHAAILIMIVVCLSRMIVFNLFPRGIWLITAVSLIWAFVAVFQGQGIISTLWGSWLLFQFPFVGLFMYLQPEWPSHFTNLFRKAAFTLLFLEVAVQLFQYLLGEVPGDNLAGTFGQNGTGNLIIFILLINSIFLGHWITSKHWLGMVVVFALSLISSVLGEMKLFIIGLLALGSTAIAIYAIKNRVIWRLSIYVITLIVALFAFIYFYNRFVPGASQVPLPSYIQDPQLLSDYLNREDKRYVDGKYFTNLGRNAALVIGWNSLQGDPVTLLFGWGIGARSESATLGTTGLGIQRGDLGLTSGTGLLVKMQEMGVLGLTTLAAFFLWVIVRLLCDIKKNPRSEATALRYALVLFSVFWPVWLWYNNLWISRVPMMLYWATLGYVLAEADGFPIYQKIKQLWKVCK